MNRAAKKHVLITFGDNDFAKTLRAFGDVISTYAYRETYLPGFLTKGRVVELWGLLAEGLYWVAQNGGRDDKSTVRGYLKIDTSQVFLDEEATEYIDDNQGRWNNSWVLINLNGNPSVVI